MYSLYIAGPQQIAGTAAGLRHISGDASTNSSPEKHLFCHGLLGGEAVPRAGRVS